MKDKKIAKLRDDFSFNSENPDSNREVISRLHDEYCFKYDVIIEMHLKINLIIEKINYLLEKEENRSQQR